MRSYIRLHNNLRSLLLFLLVVLAVSYFWFTGYSHRLDSARQLLGTWKLVEAEAELQSLAKDFPSSLEIRRFYAECLFKRGELRKAQEEFAWLIQSDSTGSVADHAIHLGFIQFYLGNMDSASLLAQKVLDLASGHSDSFRLTARAYNLLGRIAFNRARYDSAHFYQWKSLQNARRSGSAVEEANALRQLGVLYWYDGKTDSAVTAFYEPALALYQRANDKIGETTTLNNIALARQSLEYHIRAFSIRKTIGDQIGLADSYYFISPTSSERWFDFAYSLRRKALDLSTRIGYAWGQEVAARAVEELVFGAYDSLRLSLLPPLSDEKLSGEGRVLQLIMQSSESARRNDWNGAAATRLQAVRMCDSIGYTAGLGMALAQYTLAAVQVGDYREAEEAAVRLQSVWAKLPLESGVVLAEVYVASAQYTKASKMIRNLIETIDQKHLASVEEGSLHVLFSSGYLMRSRYKLFDLLLTTLSPQRDHEEIFVAMERFRSLPIALMPEEGSMAGEETIFHRYVSTIKLIDKGSENAAHVAEQFVRAYRQELERRTTSAQASRLFYGRRMPTLRETQRQLRERQTLVQYFIGREDAYLLAVQHGGSFFSRLPISTGDLHSSIRTFNNLVLRGKADPNDSLWKGPAKFLFGALIQPLIDGKMLSKGDHLIISPQGSLHNLTFAALLDSAGKPTVENYIISLVPSADHLMLQPRRTLETLAAFAPDTRSLPYTYNEVRSAPSGVFRSVKILRDSEATGDKFLAAIPTADVVHVAAHGKLNPGHPLFSRLEFADGGLELHRVLSLTLPNSVVILSACETGYGIGMMGDISHGHEVISFPHAFLQSGASAVIAPLWVVQDEATARLFHLLSSSLTTSKMSDGSLREGAFANALTMAQMQLASEQRNNHPFFWAGFYLLGNPNSP